MSPTRATFVAITDIGPARDENQDSIVVASTLTAGSPRVAIEGEVDHRRPGSLLAVIDGMGGHRGGLEASSVVARCLLDRGSLLVRADAVDGVAVGAGASGSGRADVHTTAVDEMLAACNSRLYGEMAGRPPLRGMGAAIAGLACLPGAVVAFNLGDARVYQHAAGYLLQVSEDHRAPSGTLLQCLGGTAEPVAIRPFSATFPMAAGTRWLLCSDGLSDFVPFPHLQECLATADLREAATRLVDAAGHGGSTDNVSLIVVDT